MKNLLSVLLCVPLIAVVPAVAQDSAVAAQPVVPHLVRYSGAMPAAPASASVIEVRFAVYAKPAGGEALWTETQQVALDTSGKYSVLLGSVQPLPDSLFAAGEARWVGVTLTGQPEGARTPLAASAYSLKASDSETVGGHPASDFVLAAKSADGKEAPASTPITQINISNGITGGGTGPTVSLSISTSYLESLGNSAYAQLNAANTLTGNQTINGNLTVNGTFGGSAVSGLLTAANGVYPQLAANNTMSGTNTFSKPITFASAQTFAGTATLAGNNTFAGTNAFSKALTFASGQTFPGTATLAGTNAFTGSDSFSKAVTFASGQTFPGAATLAGTNAFTGTNSFSTAVTFASGQTFPGTVSLSANNAFTGSDSFSKAITFASGQTFPGTVSLSANNTFTGTDSFSNPVTFASSQTFAGTASTSSGNNFNGEQNFNSSAGYNINATNTSSNGDAVIGVATGSSSTGIEGIGAYIGVNGYGTGTGSYGVLGQASSGVGVEGTGATGVYGSGTSYGVFGTIPTSGGSGVFGSATNGMGVTGSDSSGGDGVFGNSSSGNGVYGSSSTGPGVYGYSTSGYGLQAATSAATYAIYGTASASGATGVYGSAGSGYGVQGQGTVGVAGSTTAAGKASNGVFGDVQSTPSSTYSNYPYAAGVAGDMANLDGSVSGSGMLATADNLSALTAENNSANPTVLITNLGTSSSDLVFETYAPNFYSIGFPYYSDGCSIDLTGDLYCTGSVNSMVPTSENRPVTMYGVQATENWFEDFGSGAIQNGRGHVTLDPTFAATVNTSVEYHVFLSPEGESKGLYIAAKSADGFDVREVEGGNASIAFSYRIVAKRKGYEQVRMADLTDMAQKHRARLEERRRAQAAMRATPRIPAPAPVQDPQPVHAPQRLLPPPPPPAVQTHTPRIVAQK